MSTLQQVLMAMENVATQHDSMAAALTDGICPGLKSLAKTKTAERADALRQAAALQANYNETVGGLEKVCGGREVWLLTWNCCCFGPFV